MGMRFRKSKKIAAGVRLNVSKGGVGLSFGGKGARYSVHSSGRRTKSVGIPGSGISYVSSSGGGKKRAAAGAAAGYAIAKPKPPALTTNIRTAADKKKYLIVTAAFGWLGVHYFMAKRFKMGLLYLCTVGLFMFGWLIDIVRVAMVKPGAAATASPLGEVNGQWGIQGSKGPGRAPAVDTTGMDVEQAALAEYTNAKAHGDLMSLHYALNTLIEHHYKLGKESPEHVQKCIQYCQEDIDMYEQLVPLFQKDIGSIPRLPAFQRIVMCYDQIGEYEKAIEVCKFAAKRQLSDGTQGGFKARRERIEKKMNAATGA